jgi:hypothetical protein
VPAGTGAIGLLLVWADEHPHHAQPGRRLGRSGAAPVRDLSSWTPLQCGVRT